MNGRVESLALDCIVLDGTLQPRCTGIDEAHVETLMEAPENWPPVTVAMRGDRAVMVDGFHRYEAALRLGQEYLTCNVIDVPPEGDYFRLAFDLNAAHGRPLTLADRKAYAATLLQTRPTFSDREIGRRTGLSHTTVAALRAGQNGQSPYYRIPQHKPGEIEGDIGLFDPIRRSKATKEQKATAGYISRLVDALEEPYIENDGVPILAGWSDDPVAVAQACFAAMPAKRASDTLNALEYCARFLVQVARARKSLAQSHTENES